jgi:uncharacterized protein YqgQ
MKNVYADNEKEIIFKRIFHKKPSICKNRECMLVFFYLLEHGPSTQSRIERELGKKLKKKINVRRAVSCKGKLRDEEIVIEVDRNGTKKILDLSPEYKVTSYDQMLYLERLEENTSAVSWGYLGYGGFEEFMGNHTTYGLPGPNELTDYEERMTFAALRQIDRGLRCLQEIKLLTEARKYDDNGTIPKELFPNGVYSLLLTADYVMHYFSHYLRNMMMQANDPFAFLEEVKEKSRELLCEKYSQNSICKEEATYDDHSGEYQSLLRDKKGCIDIVYDTEKRRGVGSTMDVAVISTKNLLITEEHQKNVEAVLDRIFWNKNIKPLGDRKTKIRAMEYIIHSVSKTHVIDKDEWLRNKLKFPKYNRFEEIFNLKEIKAMTSVLDKLPDYIKKYARKEGEKTGPIPFSSFVEDSWKLPFEVKDIIQALLIDELFGKKDDIEGAYYDEWIYTDIKKTLEVEYGNRTMYKDKLSWLLDYFEAEIIVKKILPTLGH